MKNLRLHLNVNEDEDLRNYVKELVKGQILSILRTDLSEILNKIVQENRKLIEDKISRFDVLNALSISIKEILPDRYEMDSIIEKRSEKIINDYIDTYEQRMGVKFDRIVKTEVEKQVRNIMSKYIKEE